MKRRLLASLSVLFILSSINAQVFAADSSLQEITFNEYYSAIQDISVDEPTLRITAATGYDDYISLVSYDYSVSRNNTADAKVTVNITCEVKESVSIGGIESWAYVTKNYSVSFTPLKGL